MGSINNLHEPCIDAPREARVPLDGRPQCLDRRCFDIRDDQYRMGIAHRDGADLQRYGTDLQGVAVRLSRGIKRQAQGVEAWDTHVDGDCVEVPNRGSYQSRRTVQREGTAVGSSTPLEESGDASCTVAALLDLIPVGIEDPIEDGGVGPSGSLQDQGLVEPDTDVAVREAPELFRGRERPAGRSVEDDEVVANSVHLREVDPHGHSLTEFG